MDTVGFKPTISAGERPQTFARDRAATGTGIHYAVGLVKLALTLWKARIRCRVNRNLPSAPILSQMILVRTTIMKHFNTLRTGDADLRF